MPRSLCGKEKFKPWSATVSHRDMADISTQLTVNRLSRSFCSWLKTLPGSGSEAAQWNEKDIRRMFDIFNKKDRKVKQVKNWTKFGTSIKLVDRSLRNKVQSSQNTRTGVQVKLIEKVTKKCEDDLPNAAVKESSPKKAPTYGAYYLKPKTWSRTGQQQKEESFKEETVAEKVVEQTRNITTKSFEKYLKTSNQYSKVLIEILQ